MSRCCGTAFAIVLLLLSVSIISSGGSSNDHDDLHDDRGPFNPLVNCSFLWVALDLNSLNRFVGFYLTLLLLSDSPIDFIECQNPVDHKGNATARDSLGYGCLKVWLNDFRTFARLHTYFSHLQMGGQRYEDVEKTEVVCTVLEGIECRGNRTFKRPGFPCIKSVSWYVIIVINSW